MSQHIAPLRSYLLVFFGLVGLTLLTTGVAFVDLGAFNTVVALAIACAKMMLVLIFFMHLRHSSGLSRIVVVAGFFWLLLLMSLTAADYHTRNWTPQPDSWSIGAPPTHP